jgi:DNA-binding Lrp family transcriptional regulator
MLDTTDVAVLSALSEEPLASFDKLGRVSGLSPAGTRKRMIKLVENGFLSKQFVRAQVNYSAVGLETVIVLVDSSPASWSHLEAACDAHPYTQFRIRVMGSTNGFVLVFAVPQNSRSQLLEFLAAMKARGFLNSYSVHLPVSNWGHSETRFSLFDPLTSKWHFNWGEWESEVLAAEGVHSLPPASIAHELDKTDVAILRALSVDARAEKKGLAEKLGIKDYDLSRRLKFIEDNHLVSYYRVTHETGILGIAMTVVLKCKASLEFTGKVLNSANRLPFQGSVYPLEDGFLVLANMPPEEVTGLVTTMQKHCSSVDLMWGDYSSSMKYFFDNDPSNFGPSAWNTDRHYMIDAPLRSMVEAPPVVSAP